MLNQNRITPDFSCVLFLEFTLEKGPSPVRIRLVAKSLHGAKTSRYTNERTQVRAQKHSNHNIKTPPNYSIFVLKYLYIFLDLSAPLKGIKCGFKRRKCGRRGWVFFGVRVAYGSAVWTSFLFKRYVSVVAFRQIALKHIRSIHKLAATQLFIQLRIDSKSI